MNPPKWLSLEDVRQLQIIATERDLALEGGLTKPELLSSALARVQNAFYYKGETDVFHLAALYAESIAQNHPFADANKRTAFLAADLFLLDNGFDLEPASHIEHADLMVALTKKTILIREVALHFKKYSKVIVD